MKPIVNNLPLITKTLTISFLLCLSLILAPTTSWAKLIDVRVTVACDQEWIKIYGDHWKDAALNAIEEADIELIRKYGINLCVHEDSYIKWNSNYWERNLTDLLEQVYKKVKTKEGDDILVAFTGRKTDYVGMAYVNGKAAIVMHQNSLYDAIVTRHEISHILGCLDEDPPIKSIMSEWWDYPDTWSPHCEETIWKSRERFVK